MTDASLEATPDPVGGTTTTDPEASERLPAGAPEPAGARPDDRLAVAMVRGVHGLQGAVRVEILTDKPEQRYAVGSVLHREGSERPLTVTWSSAVADGPGWRLQFAEVRDRSAADALKGAYLEVDAGPDAALPRGAYFWHEVVGTTVTSTDGAVLGTIQDVYRSGGAEVYVVSGGDYGEFDVPAVRDFIRIFAPRRGEIVVDTDALDLTPPKRRRAPDDPDRPRAPRRRAGSRRAKAESERGVRPDAARVRAGSADAAAAPPADDAAGPPANEPAGADAPAAADGAPRPNPFDVLRDR